MPVFYWMHPAPNYVMSHYTPQFKTFEELSSHFSGICIIKTCVDLLISLSLQHPMKRVVVLLASWVINIIYTFLLASKSFSKNVLHQYQKNTETEKIHTSRKYDC